MHAMPTRGIAGVAALPSLLRAYAAHLVSIGNYRGVLRLKKLSTAGGIARILAAAESTGELELRREHSECRERSADCFSRK